MKKLLFICSQNKLRSPTAETVFANTPDWEVRSAGLNHDAIVPLDKEDVEWANYIFVMESTHKRKLQEKFRSSLKNQTVICLNIPDNYEYMDEDLVDIFKQRIPQFVN
jgi:predicted protein tyrosine phosphatase